MHRNAWKIIHINKPLNKVCRYIPKTKRVYKNYDSRNEIVRIYKMNMSVVNMSNH